MAERVSDAGFNGKKGPAQDSSEGQAAECEALEESLARLRAAYEQYFMGVDRHPPSMLHNTFKQRLERLKASFVRNTVVRFRLNNLLQKASTYERLWARTLSEIENGTYRKDLFKVRRKRAQQEAVERDAKAEPPSGATPAPTPVPEAAAPNRPPQMAAAKAAVRAKDGGGASQLSDARIRDIYDAYVAAKRSCKEDTSKLTMESLASTLRKQVPELLKRHQSQGVDFKVVIKDGKAVLRAVPK